MNCAQFGEWLDQGSPGEAMRDARSHLEICALCAASLSANREVEKLISQVETPAPTGFVLNVMSQVREFEANRVPVPFIAVPDFLPWWVRAAMQPATVLALVLLSVVLWQADQIMTYTSKFMTWVSTQGSISIQPPPELLAMPSQPWILVGIILGFAPLFYMLWLVSFRGAMRFTMRVTMSPPALARH